MGQDDKPSHVERPGAHLQCLLLSAEAVGTVLRTWHHHRYPVGPGSPGQDVHHRLGIAAVERFLHGVVRVELMRPRTLEVNGVEQIADCLGIEGVCIEQVLNHAHRVVAGPLVDDVHRLAVGEVAG